MNRNKVYAEAHRVPDAFRHLITPFKKYIAHDVRHDPRSGISFYIDSDAGFRITCAERNCSYLRNDGWRITDDLGRLASHYEAEKTAQALFEMYGRLDDLGFPSPLLRDAAMLIRDMSHKIQKLEKVGKNG